jgi:hypothetical protein
MLLCYTYCNEHWLGGDMIDRLKQKGMGIIQVLEYPQVLNALNAIKLIRSKS